MPANMAVNSTGWMVTSKNCSKLRRIFFVARHAITMVWVRASAGLTRRGSDAGSARTRAVAGGR